MMIDITERFLNIEIPGSFCGKEDAFEYIIEPEGVTVNHRLFKPNLKGES